MDDLVQSLWIGERLSVLERLSICSFLAHGHRYRLHVYGEVGGVPDGVELADAGETLPAGEIFEYRKYGSVAGFSNWFRYELLRTHGGFWVDTDVVCLHRFEFEEACVFGLEDEGLVNSAVLRLPRGHALAHWLASQCRSPNRMLPYDGWRVRGLKLARFLRGNRRSNQSWGETGPEGLTAALRHFGMQGLAQPRVCFYPVRHTDWRSLFDGSLRGGLEALAESHGVHFWNEMTRRDVCFDKDRSFPAHSIFEILKRRYLD